MGNATCCKYLMFVFNLLIFLGGGLLLGLGIWAVVGADSLKNLLNGNTNIFDAVYVIIAAGALLVVVGFFGCCGAIKENRCMLGTFFGLVLIIFIIEIVGGILAFVYYPSVEKAIVDSISLFGNSSDEAKAITATWKAVQETGECCGFNGPSDYPNAPPPSCGNFEEGCKSVLQGAFIIVGAIALAVLVIELLAMIFACCVYQNVKKDSYA